MAVQEVLSRLLAWLPFTARQAVHQNLDPNDSPLLKHPGMQSLATNPDVEPMLGAARMLSADSTLPADHLFTALLRTGLVQDMLFLLDGEQMHAHLVVQLGSDVCGHAKIVHGGLLSSICDETYGALIYTMKQRKALGPEAAVTANLSINYRKPTPTQACVKCTVKLVRTEGRKVFMEAAITDLDSQQLYADSSALFINLRPEAQVKAMGEGGAGPLGTLQLKAGPEDVAQWHVCPRYDTVCKEIGL